jgi:hypothetical protein
MCNLYSVKFTVKPTAGAWNLRDLKFMDGSSIIKMVAEIPMSDVIKYLSGKGNFLIPQMTVNGLDVILSHIPNFNYYTVDADHTKEDVYKSIKSESTHTPDKVK